ncbi:MAG: efflux RND transporter periplasmic adaptor subunit [Parachlamydiaceae bacterium]|nr:efflux RND transporter periplasmic adaptor subunit [Parachlamydiaceae bacterium]
MISKMLSRFFILATLLVFNSCSNNSKEEPKKVEQETVITNRIKVSPDVISNFGITFEKVSSSKLGTWLTVPGKLQIPRESRFVVGIPTRGRVFWKKSRLDWLNKDDVVAAIESPALSQTQQELGAALQNLHLAKTMKDKGNGSSLRFTQAERKYRERLGVMGLLTGYTSETLENEKSGVPFWSTIKKLEIRAPGNGILYEVNAANGEILEEGAKLGVILDTSHIIFRGLISSDIYAKIPNEALIKISIDDDEVKTKLKGPIPIGDEGTSKVWLEANVPNSTKNLIDGLPVISYVQIKESEFEEAVVPERCVVFDQLEAIVFKRDPIDPDFVIRTSVEIGNRSGGYLEIIAGLMNGDEIVCEGIHQLKQMGSVKPSQKGHFHADGTWHEGDN